MLSSKNRLIGWGVGLAIAASAASLFMFGSEGLPLPGVPADGKQGPISSLTPPPVPATKRQASLPAAPASSSAANHAIWSRTMQSLRQQTPAQLVHRAAVSKQPPDVFAAYALIRYCGKSANPALVAHAAPSAPEQMKRALSQLQDRCSQAGSQRQLDYVVQSWPADAAERRGYEAIRRVDRQGVVDFVLSTGSADFAAQLLPGYVDAELLQARGLLPALAPEAADLEGTGPLFDLASVSRLRDQFAVSWSVALWSCSRLGTCVEEAQLDYNCHALNRCVEDWRDFPEQVIFQRGPLDPSGTPNFFWVSRARWAQIQQAVNQLLGGLH